MNLVCVLFLLLGAEPIVELPPIPSNWPEDTVKGVKAYIESSEKSRKTEIILAEARVASLPKLRTRSAEERKKKAEDIKAAVLELKLLKADVTFPSPVILVDDIKSGAVGRLVASTQLVVARVVITEPVTVRVSQIIDKTVIVETNNRQIAIIGLDQSNLVDGAMLELTDCFQCVGPRQYPKVSGAMATLMTLEVFPHIAKVQEYEKLRLEAYEKTVLTKKK